jgi:hypothetical protein
VGAHLRRFGVAASCAHCALHVSNLRFRRHSGPAGTQTRCRTTDMAGTAGCGGSGCKRSVAHALHCCAAPLDTTSWLTSDSRALAACFDSVTLCARARHVHARCVLHRRANGTQTATGALRVTRRVLRSDIPAWTCARHV